MGLHALPHAAGPITATSVASRHRTKFVHDELLVACSNVQLSLLHLWSVIVDGVM